MAVNEGLIEQLRVIARGPIPTTILYGSAAIAVHAFEFGLDRVRAPKDIDLYTAEIAVSAVALMEVGYCRSGAYTFKSPDFELPVQLWVSGEGDQRFGIIRSSLIYGGCETTKLRLASLPVLLSMKILASRGRKDAEDVQDIRTVISMMDAKQLSAWQASIGYAENW